MVLNIFYYSGFEQLALALKNKVRLELTVLHVYFYHSGFEQLALALALKNRVALKFFTVSIYFLSFRIFEASCACPEKQSSP